MYTKTAKDIAWDRERSKYQKQIRDLRASLSEANSQIDTLNKAFEAQALLLCQQEEDMKKLQNLLSMTDSEVDTVLTDAKRRQESQAKLETLLGVFSHLGAGPYL